MLWLASKTTPTDTGESSEPKYLSCCSTPSSYNWKSPRSSPVTGAPRGSVTVTGISVSLTSTRISDGGCAVRSRAARGEIETRGPDSCAPPGNRQHEIAMETSALENQRARIYDSPELCDYSSARAGTKDHVRSPR